MASNFKILVHRNTENLHLTLLGDFDGTSACELLNILKKKCNGADRVFIHTSGLKKIYPFGQSTFLLVLSLLCYVLPKGRTGVWRMHDRGYASKKATV